MIFVIERFIDSGMDILFVDFALYFKKAFLVSYLLPYSVHYRHTLMLQIILNNIVAI